MPLVTKDQAMLLARMSNRDEDLSEKGEFEGGEIGVLAYILASEEFAAFMRFLIHIPAAYESETVNACSKLPKLIKDLYPIACE